MKRRQYDVSVFIGRMQPPHKEHIRNIKKALEIADNAIIVLGSHRAARNPKNPFTLGEREIFIRACFSPEENNRLYIVGVRDYYYNDNIWVADVQQRVQEVIETIYDERHVSVALVGLYKDISSYYLDMFPQWAKETVHTQAAMSATDVRSLFFNNDNTEKFLSALLEPQTLQKLLEWKQLHIVNFENLRMELEYYTNYKKMFAVAPFPVTFTTTDVVVIKSGHVLLVRRKVNPGKGLLALPGGFLKQNLSTFDSALEELKEETRILMPKESLKAYLKDEKVFDYPERSLRGRTITHAFCFELPVRGDFPKVKGDDDAEKAMWVPIADVFANEEEMFEDHLHIISYFYNKPIR